MTSVTDRSIRLLECPHARGWLGLALATLVIAGILALVLVLGRMPPFDSWVQDPQFFRRCLVVHVNLALVLWFYSFIAVLLFQLPARPHGGPLATLSLYLGFGGLSLVTCAAWLPDSAPVMSNYVPMVDHWLFGLGQASFAAGVGAVALSRSLLPATGARTGVAAGLRATVLGLTIALVTLVSSFWVIPSGLQPAGYYELLFWGAGHVLQLVSAVALVTVWLMLARAVSGREPLSPGRCTWLFALLVLPWLVAPLLPIEGAWSATYKTGFTRLMQFGMLPVLVFLVLLLPALRGVRRWWRDPRASGLLASMVLLVAGMVLGAMIRDSNTVIPAHYHAAIGAVTVAFMAIAYHLLGVCECRGAGWHPLIYGTGQLIFAGGFALAGLNGAARKVYGAEQAARGPVESLGLVVMGVGGLIAVVGGLIFLFVACRALLGLRRSLSQPTSPSWTTSPSTRSRS